MSQRIQMICHWSSQAKFEFLEGNSEKIKNSALKINILRYSQKIFAKAVWSNIFFRQNEQEKYKPQNGFDSHTFPISHEVVY